MASKHTSQNFKFQYYVDMAKQKEISWHFFVNLMEDLSYSDVNRLKYLNTILLTELTVSYSDMDRLKYLNVILMTKFKDLFQLNNSTEVGENKNLDVDKDLNDETIKEILFIECNSQNSNFDQSLNEENFKESTEEILNNEDVQLTENGYLEDSQKSKIDQILNKETIEESTESTGKYYVHHDRNYYFGNN